MNKRIELLDMKWLILLIVCLPFMTSCENADLPAFSDANITKVGAYHRYYSSDKDAITGEFITAEKELGNKSVINSENATISTVFTVPAASGSFTTAEREKVSLNNLVVYVNISNAARIFPIDGAPKLGEPKNWTQEHKYRVEAADGTVKVWTLKVTLNK